MKERLEELWKQATGLGDADCSPLAQAIINECLARAKGVDNPWKMMSDVANNIKIDVESFRWLLDDERYAE